MSHTLQLHELPGRFAVARLKPDADVPAAWLGGPLTSVTRTAEELSVVTDASRVPADAQAERDWCALAIRGPIPFELTGVLSALLAPLADAGISIFALSTYDTDVLLVRADDRRATLDVLRRAGHSIEEFAGSGTAR